MREITETDLGLELQVDGSCVALIRERHQSVDLIWMIRGPQNIEAARQVIPGLIDLLIAYDAILASPKKRTRALGAAKEES